MAKLKLILQAATESTHAAAIRQLFGGTNPKNVLISVGFVRESGVAAIEQCLKPVAAKTTYFVGIRNDITSVQGVKRLLALKTKVFAVDTGSRDTIFHPKLYLAWDDEQAGAIVGSANLTFQGLHNNIEASTVVKLDMNDKDDRGFVEESAKLFQNLVIQFPAHVFEIKDENHADLLFNSGRLSDERVVLAPAAVSRILKGERDTLPRMKLNHVAHPQLHKAILKGTAVAVAAKPKPAPKTSAAAPPIIPPTNPTVAAAALPDDEFYLVWESKPLTERDLNVPTEKNTHKTYQIGLDKGLLEEDVDFQHYFRDSVFAELKWNRKSAKEPHIFEATAEFEVVVKNLNYGNHQLTLTHNSLTNTTSYKQKQAMTKLRWGSILPVIARPDLIERTLKLYRKGTTKPSYLIEID